LNFGSADPLPLSVDNPDFSPAVPVRFLEIIGQNVGNVSGKEGMEIERILDRNPSHGSIHNSQFTIQNSPSYTSSITTDTGIAAFATFEMMQYFSARERVFST
jgi:hypothetical protein